MSEYNLKSSFEVKSNSLVNIGFLTWAIGFGPIKTNLDSLLVGYLMHVVYFYSTKLQKYKNWNMANSR